MEVRETEQEGVRERNKREGRKKGLEGNGKKNSMTSGGGKSINSLQWKD